MTLNMPKPIQDSFSSKKLYLVERDKELKQLMYAMLLGEHLFLQGPAGTGKSLLANHAFRLVGNSKTFNIQMTEATLAENLFGAYDMATYKNKGVLMRDTRESIIDADFAFLDEIFDAREDILRTLLGVLNEKKFSEGKQQEDAKLHTAVATANYTEINEKTLPLLDRFIFKATVSPLKSKSNRKIMYKQHLSKIGKLTEYEIKPIMDLKQLKDFTNRIYSDEVKINSKVLDTFDSLITEYVKEKTKYVSSRTMNKLLDIVKAVVLLDDRKKAEYTDLYEVKYGLCTINDEEDERIFDIVYKKCVECFQQELEQLEQIKKIEDELQLDNFLQIDLKPNERIARMKGFKQAITDIASFAPANDKVSSSQEAITNKIKQVLSESQSKFFENEDL